LERLKFIKTDWFIACCMTVTRVVTTKMLALTQEFDEEAIKDIRGSFFHEADAAGRLNHPNNVIIYNAEEHNFSYIAMQRAIRCCLKGLQK